MAPEPDEMRKAAEHHSRGLRATSIRACNPVARCLARPRAETLEQESSLRLRSSRQGKRPIRFLRPPHGPGPPERPGRRGRVFSRPPLPDRQRVDLRLRDLWLRGAPPDEQVRGPAYLALHLDLAALREFVVVPHPSIGRLADLDATGPLSARSAHQVSRWGDGRRLRRAAPRRLTAAEP